MTINFDNNGILVKNVSEIPTSFLQAEKLYLDVETKSDDPTKDSLNPWRTCAVAGIAITVDNCQQAYYLDYRYTENFRTNAAKLVQSLMNSVKWWINHNIKYDMHVLANDLQIVFPKTLRCRCTIASARLRDSDRSGPRGGYSLDALAKSWLKVDINPYEHRLQPYLGQKNKDYGRIPADIIGEYGCVDVFTERDLDDYIQRTLPERCKQVADTEVSLTTELFKLEQVGMPFDRVKMQIAQAETLTRMTILDAELYSLTGMDFRPAYSPDCEAVLCGKFGLPHVKHTIDKATGEETDNPSFDVKALALYSAMPYAPQDVIERIKEFRKLSQRNSLFFNPILDFGWEEYIHPWYGQNDARTGRMTCKTPNIQQFDEFVSTLIEPPKGWSLISSDASQIEKRLVIHYIQDLPGIAAYQNDPDTDFYQMVADQGGISRQAAKAVDLGIGYGEGEKKLVAALKLNKDVVAWAKAEIAKLGLENDSEKRDGLFNELTESRGKYLFKAYHERFTTLKPTAKRAEAAVKSRRLGTTGDNEHYYGYITNLYGRDRHLPYAKYRTDFQTKDALDRAWLAFPSLNQGTAADLMKERFVDVMQNTIQDLPIYAIGVVHDELLWLAPTEIARDPRTKRDLIAVLETPSIPLSVPIRWSIGVSETNWSHAANKVKDGGCSAMLQYDKSEAENLDWLR